MLTVRTENGCALSHDRFLERGGTNDMGYGVIQRQLFIVRERIDRAEPVDRDFFNDATFHSGFTEFAANGFDFRQFRHGYAKGFTT